MGPKKPALKQGTLGVFINSESARGSTVISSRAPAGRGKRAKATGGSVVQTQKQTWKCRECVRWFTNANKKNHVKSIHKLDWKAYLARHSTATQATTSSNVASAITAANQPISQPPATTNAQPNEPAERFAENKRRALALRAALAARMLHRI
jgi:hypothetical protein